MKKKKKPTRQNLISLSESAAVQKRKPLVRGRRLSIKNTVVSFTFARPIFSYILVQNSCSNLLILIKLCDEPSAWKYSHMPWFVGYEIITAMMLLNYHTVTTFLGYLCLVRAQQSGWQVDQMNATMCQWYLPRAAVIRDTLYIDGGYLFWEPGFADGTYGAPTQDGNPLGLVYQLNFSKPIDISKNLSEVFATVSAASAGQATNNLYFQYYDGAIFANDDEFYTYGGLLDLTDSFESPPEDATVGYEAYLSGPSRQFFPGFIQGTLTTGLTRYVTDGAGVSIPSQNQGFYFGGLRAADYGPIFYPSLNETVNALTLSNSLISIDMSLQRNEIWKNNTLPSSVPGRANAELAWIPVSDAGVLIAIGGVVFPEYASPTQSINTTETTQSEEQSPKFMETVAVYDIAQKVWFMQPTTGDIPPALAQGCSIVASAEDRSSHNIYWYGGFDGIDSTHAFSDDVYVLSIPSFTWSKVFSGTLTHGRSGHRCTKPYPDQMLVIGGYTQATYSTPTCLEGGLIQVFNISSSKWINSYDPAIWSDYSIPDIVTQKIGGSSNGGASKLQPNSWADPSMADLFGTPYSQTIKNWYPYATTNNSSPSATSPTSLPSSTSVSHTGLPSWGAPVLGVLLVLAVTILLIIASLIWRHRLYPKQHDSSFVEYADSQRSHVSNWVWGTKDLPKRSTTTFSDSTVKSEDEVTEPPDISEAASSQLFELHGTSTPIELSGTGMSYFSRKSSSAAHSKSSRASTRIRTGISASQTAITRGLTPRPDSPPLGIFEARSRKVSDALSSTDVRHLRQTSCSTVVSSEISSPSDAASLRSSSNEGLGIVSPLSTPIPLE